MLAETAVCRFGKQNSTSQHRVAKPFRQHEQGFYHLLPRHLHRADSRDHCPLRGKTTSSCGPCRQRHQDRHWHPDLCSRSRRGGSNTGSHQSPPMPKHTNLSLSISVLASDTTLPLPLCACRLRSAPCGCYSEYMDRTLSSAVWMLSLKYANLSLDGSIIALSFFVG